MSTQISGDTGVSKCQPDSVSQDSLQEGVAGKGPAFSAYQNVAQAVITGGGGGTNLVFGTEEYDAPGDYNPATGIFTAPVAGYYHFSAGVTVAVPVSQVVLGLRKNGAIIRNMCNSLSATAQAAMGCSGMFMNAGDTAQINASATTTQNSEANQTSTYFQGFLVRAA